jgi:DNA uptake protein ComE-like DNA-binding protein
MTGGNITVRNSALGSALILVVLLTSILAIVGALFVMSSRIDQMSTESIRQERDLDAAIASIITKLADELVLDTPGIGGQPDYYDYPGDKDTWLASMEPYDDAGTYRWGQISDLTGYIGRRIPGLKNSWGTQKIEPKIISEHETILLDKDGIIKDDDPNGGQLADADGDGVADSKWIELDDMSFSTGQPVYAAIRIIDNGGMLNINTAYLFDPCATDVEANDIDGSRIAQINLMDVVKGSIDDPMEIHRKRCDGDSPDLIDFNYECAIRLLNPDRDNVNYLPYDISDELELRNRFVLDANGVCRIETALPKTLPYYLGNQYRNRYVPIDTSADFDAWKEIMDRDDPDEDYNFRHILTAFNADRIISPLQQDVNSAGNSGPATMININMDPNELDQVSYTAGETRSLEAAKKLYEALVLSIDPNISGPNRRRMKREFAQLAVNIVDLRDRDVDVTSLNLSIDDVGPHADDFLGDEFVYGIEPFPVITQVAIMIDPNDPCNNANHYAVELFNPFSHNDNPLNLLDGKFHLVITDANENFDPNDPNTFFSVLKYPPIWLDAVMNEDDFHVVYNDPCFIFSGGSYQQDARLVLSGDYSVEEDPTGRVRWIVDPNVVNSYNVAVGRYVDVREISPVDPNIIVGGDRFIYLDRQLIFRDWVRWAPNLSEPNQHTRFYGRRFGLDLPDITWWDVVYPLTEQQGGSDANFIGSFTLGARDYDNYPTDPNFRPTIDIAVPYSTDQDLVTVGDIARIWTIGPTDRLYDPCDVDLPEDSEIFDVNVLYVEPNDPNGRLLKYDRYRRTMGETLRFVSISKGVGYSEDEDLMRLNLGDPYNAKILNYITVFDPRVDGVDNDGDGDGENEVDEKEKKINGRININTAPRFVLEQLPWMTPEIAEAIVAYRDKLDITGGPDCSDRYSAISGELDRLFNRADLEDYILDKEGFASIGELNLVVSRTGSDDYSIRHYALPGNLLPAASPFYPDLTDAYGFDDGADDDFEERDLIFARISNLVTVRSDVFTAYILVRLGVDGPQKRVIAILDRSDVYKGADKVKVIALHPVPDAR